ncbi:MAG: orotidine-5'-phosphate decarboxylase [Rhodothermales bacterium]|nr:orotidine-5'-phosphate decarboxylase [Rhodothermales bacterium]
MSATRSFTDKLQGSQDDTRSLLCVGLDPDPARLPDVLSGSMSLRDRVFTFCCDILEATRDHACAYKLNFAFFEALGADGWNVLERLVSVIPDSKIKIADAKRGDIGNTGRFYAESILQALNFDACTVSPYMGRSSVEPFLQYRGKMAFVLARTSNPDAREIQEWSQAGVPLYRHVARSAVSWGRDLDGEVGLVVGATDPAGLARLRNDCPSTCFLVPGIGSQGGDVSRVLAAGLTADGQLIINSSRSILYADSGADYAAAAERAARDLRDEIERNRPPNA